MTTEEGSRARFQKILDRIWAHLPINRQKKSRLMEDVKVKTALWWPFRLRTEARPQNQGESGTLDPRFETNPSWINFVAGNPGATEDRV